jgi:Helix-turn-helix domain
MFGQEKRAKIRGFGRLVPLDRNQKARIMTFARAWSANNRQGRQHKGPITRAYMEVLWAMLYRCHNSATGLCFPSKATIAKRAECCVDTVNEAIKVFELAGILTWAHRIYRVSFQYLDDFGRKLYVSRFARTSNTYLFNEKIGGMAMVTENPPGKLEQNLYITASAPVERKIDQTDPLELALSGLKRAMRI